MREALNLPVDAFIFATFSRFFKFEPSFLDEIIQIMTTCKDAHYLMMQLPEDSITNIMQYI